MGDGVAAAAAKRVAEGQLSQSYQEPMSVPPWSSRDDDVGDPAPEQQAHGCLVLQRQEWVECSLDRAKLGAALAATPATTVGGMSPSLPSWSLSSRPSWSSDEGSPLGALVAEQVCRPRPPELTADRAETTALLAPVARRLTSPPWSADEPVAEQAATAREPEQPQPAGGSGARGGTPDVASTKASGCSQSVCSQPSCCSEAPTAASRSPRQRPAKGAREADAPNGGQRRDPQRHCLPSAARCFAWLPGSCGGPSRLFQPGREAQPRARYSLELLEGVGLLGRGSFGSVALVRCGGTGQLLALKAISKAMLTRRRLERYPRSEKLAMQRCCSPFVVQLVATFSRERDLYLLMEAALGGNLLEAYVSRQLYASEPHARFYTACVLLGLEHLHGQRILYRDLRMENVVLSSRGYGKLCDLGMALPVWSSTARAFTVCGTPEYMAPEVASRSGYTCTADWWSLGVLLHELLTGRTPFAAGSPAEVFKKARAGVDALGLPGALPWADLVRGLCKQAPTARLPALRGGIKNVQVHPWFGCSDFDWPAVGARTMAAPFVPAALQGLQDCSGGSCPEGASAHRHARAAPSSPAAAWERGFEATVGPILSPSAI